MERDSKPFEKQRSISPQSYEGTTGTAVTKRTMLPVTIQRMLFIQLLKCLDEENK